MAILHVAYDRKALTVYLMPINAPVPEGSELIGVTGSGLTFYDSVKELLHGIGVTKLGPIRIEYSNYFPEPIEDNQLLTKQADVMEATLGKEFVNGIF